MLIVDEADNSMIDDMFYTARLADSFPGAESLLPLYYNIWLIYQQLIGRMIYKQGKIYLVNGVVFNNYGKIEVKYSKNPENPELETIPDLEEEVQHA